MPTNKEIAGWLGEAIDGVLWHDQVEFEAAWNKTEERVTLLEQMRCETCKHFIPPCPPPHVFGPWKQCVKVSVHNEGPQFCCCHWEEKK
jgi:hypothetical protein